MFQSLVIVGALWFYTTFLCLYWNEWFGI